MAAFACTMTADATRPGGLRDDAPLTPLGFLGGAALAALRFHPPLSNGRARLQSLNLP